MRRDGVVYEETPTTALFASREGTIKVYTAGHTIAVRFPTHGSVELGASAAGLRAAGAMIADELDVTPSARPLTYVDSERARRLVTEVITGCLKRAAMRAEHGCPVDRFPGRGVPWTTLAYSERFLASPFLIADVEAFFPCRVAAAFFEREQALGSSVDAAADVSDILADNWRALFSPTGEVTRPLSATLAELGERASADALWGLRTVPLTRRAKSVRHIEVLGGLGMNPRAEALGCHMKLVEDADEDDIVAACASVPAKALGLPPSVSLEHALAELVALLPDEELDARARFPHLVKAALARAKEECAVLRETARPPVPLPRIAGVRFLDTVGAVVDEGRAMNHCVATRAFDAVAGRAFLFHVDAGVEGLVGSGGATVQVRSDGAIVEARGPSNHNDIGVAVAAAVLEEWGDEFPGALRARTWRDKVARSRLDRARAAAARAAARSSDTLVERFDALRARSALADKVGRGLEHVGEHIADHVDKLRDLVDDIKRG